MANAVTMQQLQDASQDAETLEQIVNGAPNTTVTTRLGRVVPTLATHSDNLTTDGIVQDNKTQRQVNTELDTKINSVSGGYFKAFDTLANLNAATGMTMGQVAKVMSDTAANNGDYRYNGTAWVKGYDALTDAKNYVKNNGWATVTPLAASNINYTTADRKLTFANTIYVVTGTDRYQLTTPQALTLSANQIYRIEYIVATNTISAVAHNASRTDGSLVLGFVTAAADKITTYDFLYTVDGVVQSPPHNGTLINTVSSRINFDDTNAQLVFSTSVRIKTPYVSILTDSIDVANRTVSYSGLTGTYYLEYDLTKKSFRFRLASVQQPINTADLAQVTFASGKVTEIKGIDIYTSPISAANPPQDGQLFTNNPANIVFDTTAKTLTIASGVRVRHANYSATTSGVKTIAIPASGAANRLVYNTKNDTFSFVATSTVTDKDTINVGTLYFTNTSVYVVSGIDIYTLDGKQFVGCAAQASTNVGVKTGYLIAYDRSNINFDFINNKIIIADQKVRLATSTDVPIHLPATTIDLTGNDPQFAYRLLYNTSSATFRVLRALYAVDDNEVQLAVFTPKLNAVDGVALYSINGKESTALKDSLTTTNFNVPYIKTDADYEQPTLPAYNDLITADTDYTKLIARYDALMAANPDYITKTALGNDSSGNMMYQYQFCTKEVDTATVASKKPKIIMVANTHGWEKAGTYHLYFALKEICERWQQDAKLEALKWGVNFIIIPVVNMYGFATGTRKNANGVDIERNYAANWAFNSDTTSDVYAGTAPFTEAEAVMVDSVLAANTDAIYFGSHHNFSGLAAGNFLWNPSATNFGVNLAKTLAIGQTLRAKKRYTFIPQTNDYYIGYADLGAPGGSSAMQATKTYGIQGSSFECCQALAQEPNHPPFSSAVATLGVEMLINWWLLNVKYATQLYNSRINL